MTREHRTGGQLNLEIAFLDEAYHAEPGERPMRNRSLPDLLFWEDVN